MSDNTTESAAVDTATDTVVPAAETPTEALEPDNQADTPDGTETGATDDPGDVFPRSVVEKLRRENGGLRDRAKTAEDRVSALQRQIVSRQVTAAGVKPEAVFSVAQLGDLLADDGSVDADKVKAAMANARTTLGIQQKRNPAGRGGLHSGAGVSGGQPAGFESAFRPREK